MISWPEDEAEAEQLQCLTIHVAYSPPLGSLGTREMLKRAMGGARGSKGESKLATTRRL